MTHQSDLIAEDIHAYLARHETKDLLRFITCGSVDDGKSTLIGRLLHDSRLIFEDQLAAIERDSQKHNTTDEAVDLALLVDGLQAEREQGITIDVAYRYFSTDTRKFIIADCPGHEQYTRNMATGASTADLAIILIDARYGVQTQTRRHSFIASLLGIRHVIVAVNKMDLLEFDQAVFERIRQDYLAFAKALDIHDIRFVPLSALRGDNVVSPSERMPWYDGPSLMQLLDSIRLDADQALQAFRLPVQYVNRPNLDFRGFCGTIAAGVIRPGDQVTVLPSGRQSRIRAIVTTDGELPVAVTGQAVTLTLEDEIDISRGDMIVRHGEPLPLVADRLTVELVWMHDAPLQTGRAYWVKLAGKWLPGRVTAVHHRVNVNTMESEAASSLALNEIAEVTLEIDAPVAVDAYRQCRATGSLILVDRISNATLGAGMIRSAEPSAGIQSEKDAARRWQAFEIEFNELVRRHFPHWQARDMRDWPGHKE
ncbi:sulfate adenylyltransferase subunit CysN [Laribacter hongkongensis]|uniref:Sulfate adenylyltransferase subunit 1 n=1 Tax=Laribacter hongkongensis TaxID=168471 RepID=A0A248LJN9_9NEIS|nr:sulfate adenylyltransferase subunit CysN [Laribacter hongkongensis]ASJ24711.1 sulfate adenylyltransferase subunit 1 [Laribacter hongkongensis]MCG9040503.1 sulfate adenylyltransferase subunit CysN [Laribacter hongkongensis]MCG9067215.1 sulfate adenylyltransferase subunit CysN [Laribacter hongkongensis]MCG9090100.1 sulfate adenylyltransferase subunit CysN [Laribacter hongkongensis]MCG9109970.1 sulfate adenylyltransferase subunit CysN [Laribacter hongkongensis]